MITSAMLHRGANKDVNEHTDARHNHNETHAQQSVTGGLATACWLSRYELCS